MKIISPKVAVTLAALLAQATLLSGCEPPPVSNDQIVSVNRAIVELMQATRVHSVEATVAVDKAFQDIALSLRSGGVSDQWVEYLEEQRPILKLKSAKLRGDLNKMRTESASLFTLLRRRTADNRT